MGKHARRKNDYTPPAQGTAGDPGEVAAFDANIGSHVVAAADKRLFGQYPYDNEPGSKPALDPRTGNRREQ